MADVASMLADARLSSLCQRTARTGGDLRAGSHEDSLHSLHSSAGEAIKKTAKKKSDAGKFRSRSVVWPATKHAMLEA